MLQFFFVPEMPTCSGDAATMQELSLEIGHINLQSSGALAWFNPRMKHCVSLPTHTVQKTHRYRLTVVICMNADEAD